MVSTSTTFPAKSLMVKVLPVRTSVSGILNQSGLGVGVPTVVGIEVGMAGTEDALQAGRRMPVSISVKTAAVKTAAVFTAARKDTLADMGTPHKPNSERSS